MTTPKRDVNPGDDVVATPPEPGVPRPPDDRGDRAALEAAWAERVRANREQAEHFRETQTGDFYAPVSSLFVADPRRTGEPALEVLFEQAGSNETWLDIGAGAGRYALPLALRVREVIAVEPSPSMRRALRTGMGEHGIGNLRVVPGAWPAALDELGELPAADVSLIAHVGYDIEAIGPFLDAMEAATRRRCVAILTDRPRRGEGRAACAPGAARAAARERPGAAGHGRRALAPRVRVRRGADRVPAPTAVRRGGWGEGRPLPRDPARPHHPPRWGVDAHGSAPRVAGRRHLARRPLMDSGGAVAESAGADAVDACALARPAHDWPRRSHLRQPGSPLTPQRPQADTRRPRLPRPLGVRAVAKPGHRCKTGIGPPPNVQAARRARRLRATGPT